jgi:hypothetical protein
MVNVPKWVRFVKKAKGKGKREGMPISGIEIYPKQGCFGYLENGFVLFFCVSAFLYSFCFEPCFSHGLAAPHFFSFGQDSSPTPFLIIRTFAEQVKGKLEKLIDNSR